MQQNHHRHLPGEYVNSKRAQTAPFVFVNFTLPYSHQTTNNAVILSEVEGSTHRFYMKSQRNA